MGCGKDRYSKELLSDFLRSDYCANVDFVIEAGEKYTAGNLDVHKGDNTRINFLLPEELSSVSIYGDKTGNSDIFTFELSGIPASVPKSIASDLSLIFSLFSDDMASKIQKLDDDCFTLYPNDGTAAVYFTENGNTYSVFYTTVDGKPISINVKNDSKVINLTYKSFLKDKH